MTLRVLVTPANHALAQSLLETVDGLIENIARLKRLRAAIEKMAAVTSGQPTYDQIEREFGLLPGEGITLLNLIAAAIPVFDQAPILFLLESTDQG